MAKQIITDEMIADYEANHRQSCLFFQADGPEILEGYRPNDIPDGFYCVALQCHSCDKAWREIIKLEEI